MMDNPNQTTLVEFNTKRFKYPDGVRYKVRRRYFGIIAGLALLPMLISLVIAFNGGDTRGIKFSCIFIPLVAIDIYVYFDSMKWKPGRIYQSATGAILLQIGGESTLYPLNERCKMEVSYGPAESKWFEQKAFDTPMDWMNKMMALTTPAKEFYFHLPFPKPSTLPEAYHRKNYQHEHSFHLDNIDEVEKIIKGIIG